MDGRINTPVATNTPGGIIQPFRNLGGMFNLGWPHLGEVLAHEAQGVVSAGRRVPGRKMHLRTAVLNWRSRSLEPLPAV